MIYKILKDDNDVAIAINVKVNEKTRKSFPIDNSNPHYISFLRQLSEENPEDPHYLAWVEAGNNPEDFWVQEQQADALVTEEEEGES